MTRTAGSLYRTLADELAEAIEQGRLPAGSSMPSLRECSAQHNLSLNTVTAAYRLLEDRGLVMARPQSGFYVCSVLAEPAFSSRHMAKRGMGAVQSDLMATVLSAQKSPGVLDLAFAGPSGKPFYPGDRLAKMTSRVLRRRSEWVASYAMPPGSALLREQIAVRSMRLGIEVSADCIVLTHGAMEALNLALRVVTQTGDCVGVEAPSYFNLYPLLSALGLRAVEIPTHPRHGLDIDAVEALLFEKRVATIVAMPTVHNPLGCSMPVDAKRRLARLVQQHRTPLIEDLVYADLQFKEPLEPSVKAFDREGWVLACGSFSKTLAPDYRLGWITGGRFNGAIEQLKFRTSAAESLILSEAVGEFVSSGGYEHHLSTLRRLYSAQVATVRRLIARDFPDGTRATQPVGGFVLWVELPAGVDSVALFHAALTHGILIMPGQLYAKGPRYRHCVRLSCCQEIDERFMNAIRTLGALAKGLKTQGR